MGDVQIKIQSGGKTIPVTVTSGTIIEGNKVKGGQILKMSKEQFAVFQQLAGMDGKKGFSAADLKKFNELPKAKQTALINQALKNAGSKYKVGVVSDGIENASLNTKSNMAAINMTPGGKTLMEDNKTAQFFGVYIQGQK